MLIAFDGVVAVVRGGEEEEGALGEAGPHVAEVQTAPGVT